MPSLVKIKVLHALDLPGDVQGDGSCDAYVEIHLGDHEDNTEQIQRTTTYRKSVNPVWNEEFRFEVVSDSSLQNCPVEFRVIDQDLYSTEFIGALYVDLNPLIMRTAHDMEKDLVIQGTFPLYDTVKGIRGSLAVQVKLQFIGNNNPFRESSAGVQFFTASTLSPNVFIVQEVLGFVVDLVVEDDAESSWKDYFRKAAKLSNDNRLKILYNLSATVRRELGKKTLEKGGNAILGYSVQFDVEGASGIVARAYGTACKIMKVGGVTKMSESPPTFPTTASGDREEIIASPALVTQPPLTGSSSSSKEVGLQHTEGRITPSKEHLSRSETSIIFSRNELFRSDPLTSEAEVTNVLGAKSRKAMSPILPPRQLIPFGPSDIMSPSILASVASNFRSIAGDYGPSQETGVIRMLQRDDVQLISLNKIEGHIRVKLGGLVMAKSVKFLGKLETSLSDQETREGWWEELRDEIRAHAKTLCCTHVVGYSESCSILGDVCVLYAVGTAAVMKTGVHPSILTYLYHQTVDEESEDEGEHGNSESHVRIMSSSPADAPEEEREFRAEDHRGSIGGGSGYKGKTLSTPGDRNLFSDGHTPLVKELTLRAEIVRKLRKQTRPCYTAHVPYSHNAAPFSFMRLVPCGCCKRKWVPEIMLSTIEPLSSLPTRGSGKLIQARVCRFRKSATGEADAVKISDVLPFVEFDLQRQLILKLKISGMNAAFGYTSKIQVGKSMVIATATCTAMYVEALPPPPQLILSKNLNGESDARLTNLQMNVERLIEWNKGEFYKQQDSLRVNDCSSPVDPSFSREKKKKTFSHDGSENSSTDSKSSSSSSSSSSDSDSDSTGESSSLASPSSSSTSSSSSSTESSEESDESDKTTERMLDNGSRRRRNSSISSGTVEKAKKAKKKFLKKHGSIARTNSTSYGEGEDDADNMSVDRGSSIAKEATKKDVKSIMQKVVLRRKRNILYRDDRQPIVIEVDDETDADLTSALKDFIPPEGVEMTNMEFIPGSERELNGTGKLITVLRRVKLNNVYHQPGLLNSSLSSLFNDTYLRLCFNVRAMRPCHVLALSHSVHLVEEDSMEVLASAICYRSSFPSELPQAPEIPPMVSPASTRAVSEPMDAQLPKAVLRRGVSNPNSSIDPSRYFTSERKEIVLTPLSHIPGARVLRYLGPINLHFIKEAWAVRSEGTIPSFYHIMLSEAQAAVRSQVAALGGNALLSYRISPQESGGRVSTKTYDLLSCSGDAVCIEIENQMTFE